MIHKELLSSFFCWDDLEKAIAQLPETKSRGDAFEEFCLTYLKIIPEYQIVKIWIQGQFPKHIIDFLKLSGQKDQGIDLVAETSVGKIWAIQAKFRSDRNEIVSYKELSTFLAISDRADFRLIISNTAQLPSIIGKRSRCGEVLIDRLSILNEQQFNHIHKFIDSTKPVELKVFTPKPHQEEAITLSVDHFQKNNRGQLVMACGSGKTLTALWIAERLKSKNILVILPSLSLMRQTLSVWAENLKIESFNYMCICSDSSVTEDAKSDRPLGNLWEMDIPVSTDTKEASKFMQDNKGKPIVIFSTYQSGDVLSKSVLDVKDFSFDLAICDEAHRTAGGKVGLFNLVLDDKHIPSRKRLFMTATPKILAKHVVTKGEEKDVELFSMADELKYGKEIYRLTFGEAIKLGLLCDYKVIVAIVTDEEVRKVIASRNKIQFHHDKVFEREAESLAKQIAFIKSVNQFNIKHTISFHSRVEFAKDFSSPESENSIFSANSIMRNFDASTPQIQAYHVNGTIPAGQRVSIMNSFSNSEYSVITNARCLTEGVDIPSVDGVMFYDPKYRLTDIVQATGRALRLYEGKKCGYLIVPVFLKEGEDVDEFLNSSKFSQAWTVIKAMQSQDERLDETIKLLRTIDGQIKAGEEELVRTKLSNEEKIHERIIIQRIPNSISPEQFIKKIDVKLLEDLGSSWDYYFGILKAFRKEFPDRWPGLIEEYPKDVKLGGWCNSQRHLYYKRGLLSKNRMSLLNEIGFPLETEQRNLISWEDQFKNLIKFRKEYPDRWPAALEEYPKGTNLGSWCHNQRAFNARGKLQKDRQALLTDIAFPFDSREDGWGKQYEKLLEYKKHNPDKWPTTIESDLEIIKLGRWCNTQRIYYKNGKLPKERESHLRSIDFPFDVIVDNWPVQYENLIQYKKLFPDRWPTRSEQFPEENKIGAWCSTQKFLFNKNILSKDRILLLNTINFPFGLTRDQLTSTWDKHYEKLAQYRKVNPERWPSYIIGNTEEKKLGQWCNAQRLKFNKGKLLKKREDFLRRIGFIFDVHDQNWDMQYQGLIRFRRSTPRQWPSINNENPEVKKLAQWCTVQVQSFKNGKLPTEREELLKRIGLITEIDLTKQDRDKWEEQYKFLVRYIAEHPSHWPSLTEEYPSGNALGKWCHYQIIANKNGRLHQYRKKLLKEIMFPLEGQVTNWNFQYENLLTFRKEYPERWPTQFEEYPVGNQIGSWCSIQRTRFSKKKLEKDRFELLAKIGFPFDLQEDKWQKKFQELKQFRAEHPNSWPAISKKDLKYTKLGQWCNIQKISFSKGKLSQERIDLLKEIGLEFINANN